MKKLIVILIMVFAVNAWAGEDCHWEYVVYYDLGNIEYVYKYDKTPDLLNIKKETIKGWTCKACYNPVYTKYTLPAGWELWKMEGEELWLKRKVCK
jgi:hypothetical protein